MGTKIGWSVQVSWAACLERESKENRSGYLNHKKMGEEMKPTWWKWEHAGENLCRHEGGERHRKTFWRSGLIHCIWREKTMGEGGGRRRWWKTVDAGEYGGRRRRWRTSEKTNGGDEKWRRRLKKTWGRVFFQRFFRRWRMPEKMEDAGEDERW